MISLTKIEEGRLQKLGQDKETIEGLKKIFLKAFLSKESNDVNILAAGRLAITFLEDGFKELARLTKSKEEKTINENIV